MPLYSVCEILRISIFNQNDNGKDSYNNRYGQGKPP